MPKVLQKHACCDTWVVASPHHSAMAAQSPTLQDEPASSSLDSLPASVLHLIAKISNPTRSQDLQKRPRPPLLAVARCGRDAVLGSLQKVVLCHNTPAQTSCTPGPVARLLHRACTQAPVGLALDLRVNKDFPELLENALQCGGWYRVHSLTVSQQWHTTHSQPVIPFPDVTPQS
jgi:hypothetical protein